MTMKSAESPGHSLGDVTISELRVDARDTPRGIDSKAPEFSWQLNSSRTGVLQTGWQVQVRREGSTDVLWDSGENDGEHPFGHSYSGSLLRSSTTYCWRVRIRDEGASWSEWSSEGIFETGILDASEWAGQWVTAQDDTAGALYLRGSASLPEKIDRARLYVSSLGWHRLFVNGVDHTGPALVPRFTPFGKEIEYQMYDVTESLRPGENIVAIAVGDGRYRGRLGFFDRRNTFGHTLAAMAQLVVQSEDRAFTFVSDASWAGGSGRITETDPKHGERADLRVAEEDWSSASNTPHRLSPVRVLPAPPAQLIAEQVERVTDVARFRPRVWRSPKGAQLVDLGQNIAGIVRLRVAGPAGRTVRMTFSEVLDPDGELDVEWILTNPKKPWQQRDEVVLDGSEQWWQPWFTIHGFRYVQIDGLDGDLSADDVEGIALSTDVETAGSFAASDERLGQLWQNVLWSTRSNFVDTATDCPTRERSGWTGDIQVFAPTATGVVDSQAFLRRYLRSVSIEQRPNGNIPPWIPSERTGDASFITHLVSEVLGNSVGWGDVAVLTPWDLYRYYGDTATLERQYRSMQLWVRRLARAARRRGASRWLARRFGKHEQYILDSGFHWGEWLRPGEGFALLDGTLHGAALATAYFERSSRTLSAVARILGRDHDRIRYLELADRVRAAWRAAFVHDGGGRIGEDKQDDYVRALAFGLLTEDERTRAADRLEVLIRDADTHLATGFLSTPLLLSALRENGRADLAMQLLLQTTTPSWLGQVERGATTIWETWDGGYEEAGRARASHNHYAFGTVAGWLREEVAGIAPASPGYRHIHIEPLITEHLDWVEASVRTPYGEVRSRWEGSQDSGRIDVVIPAGTTAEIVTPDGSVILAGSGRLAVTWPASSTG